MPRFHCPVPIQAGQALSLPADAARHVQVLRLQPGDPITLFGALAAPAIDGEFDAVILSIGRASVQVQVGRHHRISRETSLAIHLAVGVPAGDRMDWLVEKATELGAASIQPLVFERSVLRPHGERALKKSRHWQAVAVAACEQCGRNRVPPVHEIRAFESWIETGLPAEALARRWLLEPGAEADSLRRAQQDLECRTDASVLVISGPEGGLSHHETLACRHANLIPVALGARILRAETAPLAVLAALTLGQ
jgi:16S rRNA (uracil1498-N3)-methyltransferase